MAESNFFPFNNHPSNCFLELLSALERLGIQTKLSGQTRKSYYAVLANNQVIEKLDAVKTEQAGTFRNGNCSFSVISARYDCGNLSSIKINGQEYSKNSRGMNLVVYDNICKKVVDSVCFDTFDPQLKATR